MDKSHKYNLKRKKPDTNMTLFVQNSKTGETNLWLVVIFGGGGRWKQYLKRDKGGACGIVLFCCVIVVI